MEDILFKGCFSASQLSLTSHQTQPTSHPVSYTHLRAHETVLDLVCRLLLEKKKYIISYSCIHIDKDKVYTYS